VGFHEAGFAATLNQENRQPFWFQLSAEERQQVGRPWGPANPQALNRYSYVLNNPLRWTDPSGHDPGERSAFGHSYEHVRGNYGDTYVVDGYEYKVDKQTRYLYRETIDGKQYLMKICLHRDGCKYVDSASSQFGQFKNAIDNMYASLTSALWVGLAMGAAGCVAGAAIGSPGAVAGGVAGCLIVGGISAAAGAGAVLIHSNLVWGDEAIRAFSSAYSLGPPQRKRQRR
jgi:hypothetical protein